jgi:hypothetical protein
MFVGNTTLLRTVNDTVSSSSPSHTIIQYPSKSLSTCYPINSSVNEDDSAYHLITDESIHYDEIELEHKNEQVSKQQVSFKCLEKQNY